MIAFIIAVAALVGALVWCATGYFSIAWLATLAAWLVIIVVLFVAARLQAKRHAYRRGA